MSHSSKSRLPALALAGALLFNAAAPAAQTRKVSETFRVLPAGGGPEGTLSGDVRDAGTAALIPGALVQASLSPTLTYSVTAVTGAYSLTLPVGSYTVTAAALGYATGTVAGVDVFSGTTTTQDLLLTGVPVLAVAGHALAEMIGNANGLVDQGETYALSIGLSNQGFGAAANVTGTLALDSGDALLLDAGASYGTIGPGATVTPAVPLRFQVGMGQACNQPLNFNFTAGLGQGAPVTYPISVPVGTSQVGLTTTVASTDVPLPIPDAPITPTVPNPGITSTLTLNVPGLVYDLNVRLDDVTHTFVGDLAMQLISPQGTVVSLMDQPGGSPPSQGHDFVDTILDDDAVTPIEDIGDTGPFTGRWQPDEPLAAVNGQPLAGTWRLHVRDVGNVDTGTLNAWSLEVRPLIFVCEPFATRGVAVAPAAATGAAALGGPAGYSLRVTNTGNFTDTFSLAAGLHQWTLSAPAQAGPLPAGAYADVAVTVGVPLTASVGASETVTLTVTSQGNPAVAASAVLTTTATAIRVYLPEVFNAPSSPLDGWRP